MIESQFIKTSECRFFEKYFDAFCKEVDDDLESISFQEFSNICHDCDKFNKSILISILDTIKRECRGKSVRIKNEENIRIGRNDFFVYIEKVPYRKGTSIKLFFK